MTEQTERNEKGTEAMVSVCGLSKRYGETQAIDRVSFSFAKGGIHGILGPVGAGKTTLLALLSGSLDAEEGSVTVNGVSVSSGNIEVRRKIGYLRERPIFPKDMTVEEVLDFIGASRGVAEEKRYRQIKEAIDLCGLESICRRLCARLNAEGRQRLELAGALMGNPDLLLLDEPIRGAMEKNDETVELVKMLGKIKTVVLATSDLSVARSLCSDVVLLCEGRVIAADTFAGLEEKLLGSRMLTVETKGDGQMLREALQTLPDVIGCEMARNGRTGELRFRLDHRADCDLRESVSALLAAKGAPVLSMTDSALTLEAVYRSLTASSDAARKADASPDEGSKRKGAKQ